MPEHSVGGDTRSGSNSPGDPVHGSENLLRSLVHATYWIDDGLQAYMVKHAGMSLPRAQSMAMVYLTEGVDRPSDLAVKLRVSKQAAQQALKELQAKGMISIEPDPDNGRQKIVRLTRHGRAMRKVAKQALDELQRKLVSRIGSNSTAQLRKALDADWGLPPAFEEG